MNLEALSKWVGNIPEDVVRDMADIAPMLSVLGYDPYANPPDYGKADSWVKDNTLKVSSHGLPTMNKLPIFSLCFQVKAEERLWKSRANQILKRSQDEISNLDDTDSTDGAGGANDNNINSNGIDQKET